MVSKSSFLFLISLIAFSSLMGACGDEQFTGVQASPDAAPAPDQRDFDQPVADQPGFDGGVDSDPLPPPHTDDMGQFIRDHADGGIVFVPNGTYYLSDVTDFTPGEPLVLVAETEGGVVVTRHEGAVEGETDFYLNRSRDIAFIGFHFVDATLRINDSSNIHLWYTFHTYPPQKKPRPRHKTCGDGRNPDGILLTNTHEVKFHGIEFDDIGNDAMKISSVHDAQVVGARIANVDHQNYQTETTDAEAAGCGHQAGDKYYHADALQIYPGDIHNFVVSDSYTERHMMLQVEHADASVSGFKIQRSWLSNPKRDCVTINTRVKSKASAATMVVTIVDSTSWCEPKPEKWHFYTDGTTSGHDLMIGNVTYETSKDAQAHTPADDWKATYPYEAWGCFIIEDIGWTGLPVTCSYTGFPSYRGPSNTTATKVVHTY